MNIVETVAHMMSATHYFGDVDVICDIGGQDIKVLFMQNGDIKNFRLSNQCSAGNGMLLQAMADQFGVKVTEYADVAFEAELAPKFSYGCAVFLDTDRVNFQKEGFSKEELLAGLAQVLPKNVWQYVVQIPRMAALGTKFVLQGGTQYNLAARQGAGRLHQGARSRRRGLRAPAHRRGRRDRRRDGDPARGQAQAATRPSSASTRRSTSSTRRSNDETTRCHFCPNECARTFIDTQDARRRAPRATSRGFSCEKGTVESEEAMLALTTERKKLMKEFPNLVDYESKQVFRHFYDPAPMPEDGATIDGRRGREDAASACKTRAESSATVRALERRGVAEARAACASASPRCSTSGRLAPFFRTYFETLGIQKQNVVFSDETTEEMWVEGGKYGSIDPCYPSKVAQAHIHNLLFHHHEHEEGGKKLKYIFFPMLTHVPPVREQGRWTRRRARSSPARPTS